jgi:hypothetical protein
MKTELEEVAENFIPKSNKWTIKDIFIEGAKWQQEQDKKLYSEEDMINFAQWFSDYEIPKSELISFTEQFKNK